MSTEDEMVEKGARALVAALAAQPSRPGVINLYGMREARVDARIAIDAVRGDIAAEAWDEGWRAGLRDEAGVTYTVNPHSGRHPDL